MRGKECTPVERLTHKIDTLFKLQQKEREISIGNEIVTETQIKNYTWRGRDKQQLDRDTNKELSDRHIVTRLTWEGVCVQVRCREIEIEWEIKKERKKERKRVRVWVRDRETLCKWERERERERERESVSERQREHETSSEAFSSFFSSFSHLNPTERKVKKMTNLSTQISTDVNGTTSRQDETSSDDATFQLEEGQNEMSEFGKA